MGIGVVKCGTSWTWRELGKHPQLWCPQIKEVHFFNYAPKKTWKWYCNLFSIAPKNTLVGEWTPDYFNHPEARFMVKEFCPDIKMMVMFRNPTDRAFSNYKHALFEHRVRPGANFIECFGRNWRIRERGVYSTFLKKWWALFPKEQIKILIYDDLQKDQVKFIQGVYRWLGVDDTYISNDYNRWFDFHYHGRYQDMKISPQAKKICLDYYKPSIDELEQMIGRDLGFWKV